MPAIGHRPSPARLATRVVLLIAVAAAAIASGRVEAQSSAPEPVGADERAAVVERIGHLLREQYVFPDIATSCAETLRAALDAGRFDDLTSPEAFAAGLTESLDAVSRDKHLRVWPRVIERATVEDTNPARAQAMRIERMRQQNFGFERVERLEGNVGYLDLRYFAGGPEAQPTAVAAMNYLANADALIFDMRQNGGGSPGMIRFLTSYLFDEPTHLNSLYWRAGDRTEEFWTSEGVSGPKLADVPVFVLTSGDTFSGAEEFSYNLRTRERATLIGETTRGGAHPGGVAPVNERFAIFIPRGRAINPITGTNWEGTGVTPHVAVDADDALETALELAVAAAETHRVTRAEKLAADWDAFEATRTQAERLVADGAGDQAAHRLAAGLRDARKAGIVGEMDINMLGYEYMSHARMPLAIATFEFNVEAFPESSNVHDSLGEAYMNAGRIDRAIRSYQRSIELDPGNDHARAMIEEMRRGG